VKISLTLFGGKKAAVWIKLVGEAVFGKSFVEYPQQFKVF